jgi:iron complex transport system substrate-binding protein
MIAASATSAVPARVVTLAPHLTELVYAAGAGDRLVGTVDTSDYPTSARKIPRIGDAQHLDAERLLALKPDLVIVWADGQPAAQIALIERLHLPVLTLAEHRLADIPAQIEELGQLFATMSVAGPVAADLRAQLAAMRAHYGSQRPLRAFWQVWSGPLYTVGGKQVASEMLQLCGAENVFADQTASAVAVEEESVIARRPDVLVLTGTAGENADWIRRWNARVPLPALRDGAVIAVHPDLVNRMGPRIVEGVRQLCESLAAQRDRHR